MPHTCHALDCKKPVPPKMMMCYEHWKLVPKELQAKVWEHYRPGQERDKQPSLKYLATLRECQRAVKFVETGIDVGVFPLFKDVVI